MASIAGTPIQSPPTIFDSQELIRLKQRLIYPFVVSDPGPSYISLLSCQRKELCWYVLIGGELSPTRLSVTAKLLSLGPLPLK